MQNKNIDFFVFGVSLSIFLLVIQAFYIKIKVDNVEAHFDSIALNYEYIEAVDVTFQETERTIYFLKDVIEDIHSVEIDLMGDFPIIEKVGVDNEH